MGVIGWLRQRARAEAAARTSSLLDSRAADAAFRLARDRVVGQLDGEDLHQNKRGKWRRGVGGRRKKNGMRCWKCGGGGGQARTRPLKAAAAASVCRARSAFALATGSCGEDGDGGSRGGRGRGGARRGIACLGAEAGGHAGGAGAWDEGARVRNMRFLSSHDVYENDVCGERGGGEGDAEPAPPLPTPMVTRS